MIIDIFLSYFDDSIMFYYASLLFTLLNYDSNSSKLIFMFFMDLYVYLIYILLNLGWKEF